MVIDKRREIAYMLGAYPIKTLDNTVHPFLVKFGSEKYDNSVWSLEDGALSPEFVLAYESNYNLLFSGVEFIESLGYKFPIDGTKCKVYRESSRYGKEYNEESKKLSIFNALYDFAIIYNKNRIKQSWED